jgi:hypothetical protein
MSISTHIGDAYVMATTSAQVQQLYVAYLGRAADKAGLDYWTAELNADPAVLTLEDLRANFVNEQAEYAAIYGGLTREDTVAQIYNNLFGRAPDAAGLTYWTTGGGASVNADQLLTAFINGASATDSQTVTNKVLVSEIYTNAAGGNFLAADAATIIAGVTDNASISPALNLLTNGSLSGIAVPAGISALKADIVAEAAVITFETNNVATLKALSTELATLSTTGDKAGVIVDVTASTSTTYGDHKVSGLAFDLEAALTKARGALDTDTLTSKLIADTELLAEARTTFVTDKAETSAITKINAYDAAVKAVAANPGADESNAIQAINTLAAYAVNTNNSATFEAAFKAAGLDGTASASSVYEALSSPNATDAAITKITTAFASITEFSSVKTQAALDHAANVADAALTTAEKALTGESAVAWKAAYNDVATDNTQLTASKALDAIEAKYVVTDTAHTSLVSAAETTSDALGTSNALKLVDGVAGAVGTNNADVFHFAAKIDQTNDVLIGFGAKDSLFLGEGYTLNSTATYDATTGVITGGDNNILEVFFVKDAGGVKAVIETSVIGSTTAITGVVPGDATTDGVAIITLSGVTDVAQVSYANGVISHA